jgi:hypothetical protein
VTSVASRLSGFATSVCALASAAIHSPWDLQRVRFAALRGDLGEDGRSFKVPEALQLGLNLVQEKAFGVVITGKI